MTLNHNSEVIAGVTAIMLFEYNAHIPMTIRIGPHKEYGKKNLIIQFFDARYKDARYKFTSCGQFISSYYLDTFLSPRDNGLLLDTGSPSWYVTQENVSDIIHKIKQSPLIMNWHKENALVGQTI